MKNEISLYFHYPFCLSKCPYCDFNSFKLVDFDENNFLKCYIKELEYYYSFFSDRKIKTIFLGGGTPSLISIDFLSKIFQKINDLWGIGNIEISMEANPTTFEINKFKDFKNIGINRLSIGVQSLNNEWLKFFGRTHDRSDALKAIDMAQKLFDSHYSIDLIYARPKQKINEWLLELEEATKLSPYHISLYQLIVEKGTKFFDCGVKTLDNKTSSIMYNKTNDLLKDKNIELYEVSNYAKTGYECKHNINYWQSGEWIGIGAGAHSRVCFNDSFRDSYKIRNDIENIKSPNKWMKNIMLNSNGIEVNNELTKHEFIEEIILMGLRLKKGISTDNLNNYLKIESISEILNKNYIHLKDKNYIEVSKNNINVNLKYFCILDSIIEKLI